MEVVVVWFACGLICYAIAERKGRDKVIAFACGLLFAVMAVLYYIFSKGSPEYELRQAEEKIKKLSKN